ncbi:magnesium-dependent phosphatase-1 [Picrophilus oshimae]|uniref:Magnesium-dependent phosphatase-1 n=1 Tax=Picrophilus torridus (strain ATCC 700027 / DSM 9790 / JCM 10055 / NBRC 100828 / KAW 2/3) TaxID=1122961 RepID=A0A8G2FVX0_PICTO|nr:magnesium-dependent phosphatase-1 [Picrophilus oshimae]SMD30482.1 magnesium-dependent phosphatase-1 [Picrophilus oshimae DSM 9789]
MEKPWLLAMDLDGTVWDNLNISGVRPPYRRISDNEITNGDVRIKLLDDIIDFMEWCKTNGAIIISLSWNIKENALMALREFNIDRFFDYHATDYTPEKGRRLLEALKYLGDRGIKIDRSRIVYIDDRNIHMDEIKRLVGDIIFIHMWKDVDNYKKAKEIIYKNIIQSKSSRGA